MNSNILYIIAVLNELLIEGNPLRKRGISLGNPSIEKHSLAPSPGGLRRCSATAANSSSRDAVKQSVAEVPSVEGTAEPFRGSSLISSRKDRTRSLN